MAEVKDSHEEGYTRVHMPLEITIGGNRIKKLRIGTKYQHRINVNVGEFLILDLCT